MCDSDDSMMDDIDNTTTEELVPMESINVDIHNCSHGDDSAVVKLEGKDDTPLKFSVNMERPCDKENHKVKMIISNDHSKDVIIIPLKTTAALRQKLKTQVHSSFQIFLCLVK